jgi:hypothetical protein
MLYIWRKLKDMIQEGVYYQVVTNVRYSRKSFLFGIDYWMQEVYSEPILAKDLNNHLEKEITYKGGEVISKYCYEIKVFIPNKKTLTD